MATVQRKYENELVWQAMREAGLSVQDVQVREIFANIDDERPDPQSSTFTVTFEWTTPHSVAIQILDRARALEADTPAPSSLERSEAFPEHSEAEHLLE